MLNLWVVDALSSEVDSKESLALNLTNLILFVQENALRRCIELVILHVGEVCGLYLHAIAQLHGSVLMLRHVVLVLPLILLIVLGLRIILILNRYSNWHILVWLILMIITIVWLRHRVIVGLIILVTLTRRIVLLLLTEFPISMGETALFVVWTLTC